MSKDHLDMTNLSRKKARFVDHLGTSTIENIMTSYELFRYAALLSSVTNFKN